MNQTNKKGIIIRMDKSSNWLRDMSATRINLAPQGFGRTSYRLAEIIQLGRIPAFLFYDVAWLPYEGTEIDFRTFGLIGKAGMMGELAQQMADMTSTQLKTRLEQIRRVRPFFTYQGVLEQISLFFNDPLGVKGGYLRCTTVPADLFGHIILKTKSAKTSDSSRSHRRNRNG